MQDKTNVMRSITLSPNPADSLHCIASISAFLSEALCGDRQEGNLVLGPDAMSGLCWIYRLIELGTREVAETM
jgi:hypothetical protein